MNRWKFSKIALTVAESDNIQSLTVKYLDLLNSDTWVARFVACLVSISDSQGHKEFAADPDGLLSEVEQAIQEWREDVRHAQKLSRLYPEAFTDEAAWLAAHGPDGCAASIRNTRDGGGLGTSDADAA